MKKKLLIMGAFLATCVCFYSLYLLSYDRYDKAKVDAISDYLLVSDNMNVDIISGLKSSNSVDINDNMILNGIIANYLYYNGFYDVSYDRDICKSCYKGYKSDDEVVFFKGSLVDDICMKLVGRVIKWNIYSNGDRVYNSLYYNKALDVYYMSVSKGDKEVSPVMKLKETYKNGKVLNISYYFGYVKEELDDMSPSYSKFSLLDVKGNVISSNSDILNDKGFNFSKYEKRLSVIKYVFKWNKTDKAYELKELILEK